MKDIFAIYKPKGPTSHDLVKQIRKITGIKKVGHAGTLDPLASGVLVIGIGRQATKQLSFITNDEKEYQATIKLGAFTTTDDLEGKKTQVPVSTLPTTRQIQNILKYFKGHIKQSPPQYSAVKIKGVRAYKLARQGKVFTLKPRRVLIKQIRLLEYKWPTLKLKITTGPGVYIRSLARDLGKKLKTGAYLAALERTRIGRFTRQNALLLTRSSLESNSFSKKLNRFLKGKREIFL